MKTTLNSFENRKTSSCLILRHVQFFQPKIFCHLDIVVNLCLACVGTEIEKFQSKSIKLCSVTHKNSFINTYKGN